MTRATAIRLTDSLYRYVGIGLLSAIMLLASAAQLHGAAICLTL